MKLMPHYRRTKECPLSGIKEKITWQLGKQPMTGQQLADIFGLSLGRINEVMRSSFKGDTVKLGRGEPFATDGRAMDRLYWLEAKPRRVNAKEKTRIVFSRKHYPN
ncbi:MULTISPECIES: hypothetical protein [unclassified Tatumella]|uniref:hypothetical protein n=1 Tax=unclassified Tatumella TaxID=2649542 RepID=UPI001BAFC8CF|nr:MULTISPECIES: hypothetical protein [unclassified Tatumella]MBS0878466.1 hypothetical protein [Tatumella sp. JGM82]MBS0892042.1 hypothetical protein [Tatumella sp. JGM94]MBS0903160.1 hypothetical protein [Tatumella sp. JGM100]